MKFVKYTETNDHEGESWNFWLQLDGNEAQLKELAAWLGTFDDDGESYDLDMSTVISEAEVDTLVKYGGQGYMDYNNKVTGTFVCPQPREFVDDDEGWEWLNEEFYKGRIMTFFKEK